jgi:hypothetical protein
VSVKAATGEPGKKRKSISKTAIDLNLCPDKNLLCQTASFPQALMFKEADTPILGEVLSS